MPLMLLHLARAEYFTRVLTPPRLIWQASLLGDICLATSTREFLSRREFAKYGLCGSRVFCARAGPTSRAASSGL